MVNDLGVVFVQQWRKNDNYTLVLEFGPVSRNSLSLTLLPHWAPELDHYWSRSGPAGRAEPRETKIFVR